MDSAKLIELAFYTLPALITGGVAYFYLILFLRVKKAEDVLNY